MLYKLVIFKLRVAEYAISFFRFYHFDGFHRVFVKTVMEKLSIFNPDFQNSMKDLRYYKRLGSENV